MELIRRFAGVVIVLLLGCAPALAEVFAVNYSGGAVAVDHSGMALIPAGRYDRIYALYNDDGQHTGYAAGAVGENGLLYAVLDSTGKQLTDHIYSEVYQAGDGCIVAENGVYRFLSAAHLYDDMEFTGMVYAGDGRILAVSGNIYDEIGDTITILCPDGIYFKTGIRMLGGFEGFSEGLMPVFDYMTRMYGYINNQGSWVIPPAYRYAGEFKNGLAVIAGDDGYGVIDAQGETVLVASSPALYRTENSFALVRSGSLRVYDSALNPCFVTPVGEQSVSVTNNCIALFSESGTTVMGSDGQKLFEITVSGQVSGLGGGLYSLRNGSWGEPCVSLLDSGGNVLSDGYVTLYALGDSAIGYALPSPDGPLFGLMDPRGEALTEALYSSMAYVAAGMYIADSPTGAVLLGADGSILNTFKSIPAAPVTQ